MASRKTRKRSRRDNRTVFEEFARTLTAGAFPQDTKVLLRSGDQFKMAEVLLDFIEPYRRNLESERELRCLVTIGQLAWNAALLPEEKRQRVIRRIIDGGTGVGAEEFLQMFCEMIERK